MSAEEHRELLAQRDRLAERFTMMQADLGGVLYEMLIRDHVRMDVLTRKAAELQRVDADLAQLERTLRGDVVGLGRGGGLPCPSCGAPHAPDARFCASCGQALGGPAGVARTNGSTRAGR